MISARTHYIAKKNGGHSCITNPAVRVNDEASLPKQSRKRCRSSKDNRTSIDDCKKVKLNSSLSLENGSTITTSSHRKNDEALQLEEEKSSESDTSETTILTVAQKETLTRLLLQAYWVVRHQYEEDLLTRGLVYLYFVYRSNKSRNRNFKFCLLFHVILIFYIFYFQMWRIKII